MELFGEKYWTSRYLDEDAPWDTGIITTPIKEYIDQLKDRNISILIPGAGNAHEAEYLFNNGFPNVFVIDISEAPLNNLKTRVPKFPATQLIHGDFFTHESQYDLILEQTFFCALSPSLRPRYAETMHRLLKPCGKLVGVLFNAEFSADGPPFGGNEREYRNYFESHFSFKSWEMCYNSIKPRAGKELFVNLVKR